jgi:methionyl-tRNA formyltransferase
LSFTTTVATFNLHLGISPYYRGSGTNFWPFVNKELEYVGSTILHINSGIDTGDIVCHTRPNIEFGDDVHSIGCKVIQSSVQSLLKIMKMIDKGIKPFSTSQWSVNNEKYYKTSDFNEEILLKYKNNLKNGLIENYISNPKKIIKLINLRSF